MHWWSRFRRHSTSIRHISSGIAVISSHFSFLVPPTCGDDIWKLFPNVRVALPFETGVCSRDALWVAKTERSFSKNVRIANLRRSPVQTMSTTENGLSYGYNAILPNILFLPQAEHWPFKIVIHILPHLYPVSSPLYSVLRSDVYLYQWEQMHIHYF